MLIFNPAAVDEIFQYSQGIPRLINVLCDNALLMTYVKNTGQEIRDFVKEARPDPETPPIS
jgi:general secretion pathway protein A